MHVTQQTTRVPGNTQTEGHAVIEIWKNKTRVATELGVSTAAGSQWVKAARLGGQAALEAKPISSRPTRLSDAQLRRVTRMLSEGPSKYGFPTELWTRQRVAVLVRRKFGVTYDQSGIWHVLRRLNWTQQKPKRQARERDEKAIQAWLSREWPRIKSLAS